ncbi:Sulfite dehydrogenase (Cytochrome) subunit SorA apoprotein [Candidatus Sulfopaludibacter sp. SbA4]|nr:Sulfite dehydrogenase (Cytochrome) subunit SorA apoprotein [Candidatus Sulfopaludibacter sp. SbA4]
MTAAALMTAGAARLARAADDSTAIPGKRPMILHNDRPEDLETPVRYFDSWLTPVDAFFVRQHIPRPATIDPAAYRLTVNGMVSKPLQLTLADLQKLPQATVPATIECTGNGRGFYTPKVPGIQWGRGAIGNAEWSGPRIADILRAAGASSSAAFLETDGADVGVASTPDFVRSLPMKKAMHPATILALKMNGQPIPDIHGFPARLIVPGWDGTSSVKWVIRLSAAAEANKGFFMNPGYRYPKYALPPGTPARPAELEVIEGMPVKSSITAPEDQSKLALGAITVRGFAWAGEQAIERVEVSTDGGSRWHDAQLSSPKLPFAWRLWHLDWRPSDPGYYTILSRATDSSGRVQPIVAVWNPSGYLWNAIDRVGVTVEKA